MLVIGVTGGIASGKSMVARELGCRGAGVLNADRIGHAVLRLRDVKTALHARWGEGVFRELGRDGCGSRCGSRCGSLGTVDRAAVARRVFAAPPEGPRALEFLERLTHPLIEAQLAKRLKQWRQSEDVPAVILDAPVLYKAGWERYCDRILYVDAPLETRLERVARRGWTPERLLARQEMQPSLEFQRERADVVIDNSGSLEATKLQIDAFWKHLVEDLEKGTSLAE